MAIPNVTRGGLRSARLLAAGTATRILLTPVVMALILLPDPADDDVRVLATVLFCVAAATDWVDGRLARRWNVTSKIGSFLDTTADKLLVSGVLIALLGVDRVSPWIVAIIVGRELVLMGLRGVIASEGEVMAPSSLGKLKTAIQFLAIALAILAARRPGRRALRRRVGDARRRGDHGLVGGRLPGPRAPGAAGRRRRGLSRVFLTGASGFVGGALASALAARGDDVVALARSDAAAAALADYEVVRGDVLDEAGMAACMAGCSRVYHVAGINTMCPEDPAALFHVNVRGAEIAVRAAARAGVQRVILTSSAAALGEAQGTVGTEESPHRGELPVRLRAHEARGRARRLRRRAGRRRRARRGQPVLRPGAGPRGRHRPDPDRLPQRPPARVRRHDDQPRRHRRLHGGAPARRRARAGPARAT